MILYKANKNFYMSKLLHGKTAVLTCLVIAIVFLAVVNLCGFIVDKQLSDCSTVLKNTVSEGLLAVFALFMLKITAGFDRLRGGDFTQFRQLKRRRKISMLSFLVFAVVVQSIRAFRGHSFSELRPVGDIFLFVLFVLFIGIAEEAVFRGVIAESMLCTFGKDKDGRHLAAFVSGIVFGMVHLSNMADADAVGVLVQSVGASVIGILFTEAYYSFRSLKVTIILHAGMDFLAMLEFGLFEGVSTAQLVSTYSLRMIIPYAIIFMVWVGYCKSCDKESNVQVKAKLSF